MNDKQLPDCDCLTISRDGAGTIMQTVCHYGGYSSPCIPMFCPKNNKGVNDGTTETATDKR